jgi:hypothetical protein
MRAETNGEDDALESQGVGSEIKSVASRTQLRQSTPSRSKFCLATITRAAGNSRSLGRAVGRSSYQYQRSALPPIADYSARMAKPVCASWNIWAAILHAKEAGTRGADLRGVDRDLAKKAWLAIGNELASLPNPPYQPRNRRHRGRRSVGAGLRKLK